MSRFARMINSYPAAAEEKTTKFETLSDARRERTRGALGAGAVALLAATLAVAGSATWRTRPSNALAEPPAVAHQDTETANKLSALRVDIAMIKAQLALDEDMLRRYRLEAQVFLETKAGGEETRTQPRSARQAHGATQQQKEDLQQNLKQMKELNEYARQVANTVGALDKAMSDPQFLEKRAADLKKEVARP